MIKCWVRAESKSLAESAAYDVDWTSDNKREAQSMGDFPPGSTDTQDVYEVTITDRKVKTTKRRTTGRSAKR